MIGICPRCQQRYVVENGCNDYVHVCSSKNVVLDQEDIVIVGNWEDQEKNVLQSGVRGPQATLNAGAENKLQGRRTEIEGKEVLHDLTRRGVNAQDKRQRQHEEFINFKKEGLD